VITSADGSGSERDAADPRAALNLVRSGLIDAVDRLDKGQLGKYDPLSMTPALVRASLSLTGQPAVLATAATKYWAGLMTSAWATAARSIGVPAEGQALAKDKRFADPSWTEHPGFFWLREQFTLFERAWQELVDAADVTPQQRAKARFVVQAIVDAMEENK